MIILRNYQEDIISRSEAKSKNLTRYFTNKVCVHGHISERMTSSGNCCFCLKIRKKNIYKEQEKKYLKTWRMNNHAKVLQYKKKDYYKNREKRISTTRKYYRNNRSKILEDIKTSISRKAYKAKYLKSEKHILRRRYLARKRLKNPKYNLSNRIRCRMWASLRGSKNISWQKIVNYSIKDLMLHIESKFKDGMSWDNMGKWHIDHIKPISLFNFNSFNDREFQECWDLNNLQPLWEKDNKIKSNKYNDKSI